MDEQSTISTCAKCGRYVVVATAPTVKAPAICYDCWVRTQAAPPAPAPEAK
jgi:hypothetical protein